MTVLRELFVLLGLETNNADFKRAEDALGSLKSAATAVVAAVGAIGGALVVAGRQSLNAADDLGRWQRRIGGTIEELSALKFAAEASGITGEQAFEAIVEIGERASDVVRNVKKLTGDAGESFKALGFKSVRDLQKPNGELREGIDLFDDVIGRLSKVKVATDRTGIAMRLFGDDVGQAFTAADIETLGRLRSSAKALGVTMSQENIQSARLFNQEISVLMAMLGALRDQTTFALLPTVSKITRQILEWVTANRKLIGSKIDKFTSTLTKVFKQGSANLKAYTGFIQRAWKAIGLFRYAILALGAAFVLAKIGAAVHAITTALVRLVTGLVASGAAGLAASLKMALLGAAFLAFGLIMEDVVIHLQGGQSAIGELLKIIRTPINENDFALLKLAKIAVRVFDGLVRSAADVVNLLEGGPIADNAVKQLRDRFATGLSKVTKQSGSEVAGLFPGVDVARRAGLGGALDEAFGYIPPVALYRRFFGSQGGREVSVNAPITVTVQGSATPEAAVDARQLVGGALAGAIQDAGREVGE